MPPQGGIAALEMLGNREQSPLKEWGFHSTKSLHAMMQTRKLADADMPQYIDDPGSGKLPVDQLLSRSAITTLRMGELATK